jgi:AcrR family transcriptional regulator
MVTAAAPARERILDAALELFVERGVFATSIEDVCARSGASVGSLYHHFGGKEGLARTLYAEGLAAYQAAFLDELRRHDGAEQGVRAVVARHVRWCTEHPQLMRYLLGGGEAPANANREFFAAVMAWWRPHVRYGALRNLPLDLAYAVWLGPVQEYCRLWLAQRTTVPPRRAAPVLADAAWQALKGEKT